MKPFLKICFVIAILTLLDLNGSAQDSATLKAAESNFAKGLELYNNKDYGSSIIYLLNSNRMLPKAVTYYLLCNAYCQTFDFQKTKDYAEAALNFTNPPLAAKFVPDAKKIRDFAINQLKPK